MNLVIKDAVRQIAGRVASAIWWFLVIKLITPYLGPLRFGDYSTILKYFAIWSAFADFGLYVIALKTLWWIKSKQGSITNIPHDKGGNTTKWNEVVSGGLLQETYGKFVSTRALMIWVIYTLALVIAYLIPAYTSNIYLVRGLPLGMLFSASFMSAGIVQIPLQLYWKMEHLSIGLILARIAQLSLLVFVIYIGFTQVDFSSWQGTLPFNLILVSVLLSGLVQWLYVYRIGKKHLPLSWNWDRWFTKKLLWSNRQYGVAYYLSSFHTLVVLILLSIFYPTVEWYTYAGTRALALALIEILLIVPSALGNSLIHKVADASLTDKKQSYGALLQLVIWIGCLVIVLFARFAPHVINFIWWAKYLSSAWYLWSDYILPYLGIVITFSFIKQVFNYIFVSTDLQNKLLKINLIWVIIGTAIWLPLLIKRNIIWGIIMQIALELCFMLGAIWIAYRHQVLPTIRYTPLIIIICACVWLVIIQPHLFTFQIEWWAWVGWWTLTTLFLTGISYRWLKQVMKRL